MATNLNKFQRTVCLNTRKYPKTTHMSLVIGSVFCLASVIIMSISRYRLNFPKDDYLYFIVFGLFGSIIVGHSISDFSRSSIIQKLFRNQEGDNEIQELGSLNNEERNICENSKKSFVIALWITPVLLTLIVGGVGVLIEWRFDLQTIEFLAIYLALLACSVLEGWYVGTLKYSPILTKLFQKGVKEGVIKEGQ